MHDCLHGRDFLQHEIALVRAAGQSRTYELDVTPEAMTYAKLDVTPEAITYAKWGQASLRLP